MRVVIELDPLIARRANIVDRISNYARMAGAFPTSTYNERDATWYMTLRDEAPVEPIALPDELAALLYEQARREGFATITSFLMDRVEQRGA